MILRCARCHVVISRDVSELKDLSRLSLEDKDEYIPQGFFHVGTVEDQIAGAGEFILNLGDLVNTTHHPDTIRLAGCCGPDGAFGMNRVCVNGHEIGTERSDCWMPHYVHIPRTAVETT